MEHALIDALGAVLRYQAFDGSAPTLAAAKGLRWLPVVESRPEPGPGERLVGPVVAVADDEVTRAWSAEAIPPEEIAAALMAARAAAVSANNSAAGRAREAYLTAVPGQATTYAAKQAEVGRWNEAGRPDDATADAYPWAGDRADLRAVTVAEVLAEWEAVTSAWEVVGRQIERERERVNDTIAAACTLDAIQAARDSAAYPSP